MVIQRAKNQRENVALYEEIGRFTDCVWWDKLSDITINPGGTRREQKCV